MARLRTLNIGTEKAGDVETERRILVLDGVDPAESTGYLPSPDDLHASGIPPLLVFCYDVDIPEAHEKDHKPSEVVLDVHHGDDTDMKDLIRKMVRTDGNKPTADR